MNDTICLNLLFTSLKKRLINPIVIKVESIENNKIEN